MPHRRIDGGCRGPLVSLRLLVVLILVFQVAIAKDKATNVITSTNVASTDGTSTDAGSTDVSTATDMVTTATDEPADFCGEIEKDRSSVDILNQCRGASALNTKVVDYVFNIANQEEALLNKFFKNSLGMVIYVDIAMEGDKLIKTIDFGSIKLIRSALTVIANKLLMDIKGGAAGFKVTGKITARGNRYLTQTSINFLTSISKKEKNNDIQKEKECVQDASNPHDFTNCQRIYGDLELKDFVQPENDRFTFKAVTGCFTITNTKNPNEEKVLEIEEFLAEFVTNTSDCSKGHSIDGYCLKNDAQKRIKAAIQGISITNCATCEFVCTQDDVFGEEQTGCVTIDGPLSITKDSDSNKLDLLLKNVRTVNGPVSIDGTKRKTFDFLRSLNAIHSSDSSVPALSITNNKEAIRFNFMVSNVTSQAETKFLFENNGFNCTDGDRRELLKALKMDSIKCGGEEDTKPEEVVQTTTTERSKVDGQKGVNTGDKGKNDGKNEDTTIAGWQIGLIVAFIIVLVLVICGVGGLVYWFVIRKKKTKTKNLNQDKTPSQDNEIVPVSAISQNSGGNPSANETAPPAKETAPPAKETAPPAKETVPPAKETAPPAKETAPPANETAPQDNKKPAKKAEVKPEVWDDARIKMLLKAMSADEKSSLVGRLDVTFVRMMVKLMELDVSGAKENTYENKFKDLDRFGRYLPQTPLAAKHHYMFLEDEDCKANIIEDTRVKITKFEEIFRGTIFGEDEMDGNFVVANYVDFEKYGYNQKFISAQNPFCFGKDAVQIEEESANRFLAMLLEQKVPIVISTAASFKTKLKRAAKNDNIIFKIEFSDLETPGYPSLSAQKVNLEYDVNGLTEKREFIHLSLTGWEQFGFPKDDPIGHFNDLHKYVTENNGKECGPVVIVCEEGADRSGLIMSSLFIVRTFDSYIQKFRSLMNKDGKVTDEETFKKTLNEMEEEFPKLEEWFKHVRVQKYGAIQSHYQFIAIVLLILQKLDTFTKATSKKPNIATFSDELKKLASAQKRVEENYAKRNRYRAQLLQQRGTKKVKRI